VLVPEHYEVANAIGAALARTTFETELFSDTGKGRMVIPNIGIERKVDRKYTIKDAEKDVVKFTHDFMEKSGYGGTPSEVEIIESSNFRVINDFYASGNDIRVKCQVKPGVTMKLYSSIKEGKND
jgi:hypothetical protein